MPMPEPPAQVAIYAEVPGIDRTVDFLLTFGGATLYLSEDPKGRGKLEALVGYDLAKALGAKAHLLPRRVPLAKPWLSKVLATRGTSVADIARTLRVSEVSVRKYLRSA